MRPQIEFSARTLEGALLDKLADGRWLINAKTGKPQPANRGGKHIGGFSFVNVAGLYCRLNRKTYDHAFIVVRPKRKDKNTGEMLSNGEKYTLGKSSEFLIGAIDGKRKYRINDIISTCEDWYTNGKPNIATIVDNVGIGFTLDDCLGEYLADRFAKLGTDGNIVPSKPGRPIKASIKTLDGVKTNLERYSSDWRERCVTTITTKDIVTRAAQIRDGQFVSPQSGDKIGKYNTARSWLLSMSAIHNAAAIHHESYNGFAAVLKKYPMENSDQRALTRDEIATVLNFNLDDTPRGPDLKHDPQKYLRMVALKFQLLTGLRASDVVALRKTDIKTDDATGVRYIEHYASKGRRPHYLPVPAKLGEIIDEALEVRDSNGSMIGSKYVFCSSTRGQYHNGTKAFQVARDILVDLELIKPEKVPGNGKRLMRSHDCRRTFKTYGLNDCGIDERVLNALLDHGESAMTKIYSLPTHEQRMTALSRLLPEHEKITNHFFEIAEGNAL